MGDDANDSAKEKAAQPVDPVLVAIGARIRAVRGLKERGVTETATAAGLGKGHLWRIEAGKQNFSVKILARVAAALGVTLSELLDGVLTEQDGNRSAEAAPVVARRTDPQRARKPSVKR